ncbi:MAG: hypothetical protein ACKVJ1_12295, partial [Verrucomicrobiia bacterium]
MFDALKPLLDSGIVNEETRTEIQEAWETHVTEGLKSEIEQVVAERTKLEEDRVSFNAKIPKFEGFMATKLAEELAELNEDRKAQSVTLEKLQSFVVNALAEEIAEFHKDKQSV